MSDIMRGVLCMPPSLWTDDPIEIAQRHSIYCEAWKKIERLQQERDTYKSIADDYLSERQEMRNLFPACLDEFGPSLLDAMRQELERLQAALNAANSRFHAMNSPTGREIELQAENQRLQAIVDRLPKDADGDILDTHARYW